MFGLENTLRSLTRSPFDSILAAAHRMARPLHFEEGGIVQTQAGADHRHNDGDFILPSDVQPEEVLSEIQDWLYAKRFSMPKRSISAVPSLKKTVDGRVFVPADVVSLLGDGAVDRGKRVLGKIINEIRHRRVLNRLPAAPVVPSRRR